MCSIVIAGLGLSYIFFILCLGHMSQVMVLKNPADDLGIGIIGGSEHNLPIIVSEIFPNSAVFRSKKVCDGFY